MARRFLTEDTINWGMHTKWGGGRSVLLPALRILYLLGFRRVYLLGVDFQMDETRTYHFAEDRTLAAIHGNMSTYEKLQGWLAELQPFFLKRNFVVKNCNPDSGLTAFPFMPYADAIEEATAHLGDYSRERTVGMYQTIKEKRAALERLAPLDRGADEASPEDSRRRNTMAGEDLPEEPGWLPVEGDLRITPHASR